MNCTTQSDNLEIPLLTLAELASMCSVSVRTVRRWVAGGRIPCVVLPERNYRVRLDDAADFIEEHRMVEGAPSCLG